MSAWHTESEIAEAGKALAELVKRFREMRPAGECGPVCAQPLALMDQQSDMILSEYIETAESSLGDC